MTTLSKTVKSGRAVAHHRPYARLYEAVIMRAVEDLTEQQHRGEARKWLLSPESDFAFTTAGISPQSIRQQMI